MKVIQLKEYLQIICFVCDLVKHVKCFICEINSLDFCVF